MITDALHYTLEGTTAVVRMDDSKANALSEPMIDALVESLARAEKEASAIVLTGRPDRFCAGFDLKVMMSGPENAKALLKRGSDLLMKLYGVSIPLVIRCCGRSARWQACSLHMATVDPAGATRDSAAPGSHRRRQRSWPRPPA